VLNWAHNNTCQVIGDNPNAEKDGRFKAGNIIFSYCLLNIIGVIDKDTGEIVWVWGPGRLDGQHNPQMLSNGNLLIFDNGTQRGYSRIIELDPLEKEIVWEYNDRDSAKPKFYSRYISNAHPLPDGRVFVCQGQYGKEELGYRLRRKLESLLFDKKMIRSRLFEVDRSNKITWEAVLSIYGDDTYYEVYQAFRYDKSYLEPLQEVIEKNKKLDTEKLRSLPYLR
jgi:hypothetical protein